MKRQSYVFAVLILFLATSVPIAADAKEKARLPDEGIRRVLVSTVTEDSATINWKQSVLERTRRRLDYYNYLLPGRSNANPIVC